MSALNKVSHFRLLFRAYEFGEAWQLKGFKSLNGQVLGAQIRYCHTRLSSPTKITGVDVQYKRGLPVVSVPLPSRQEVCQFTLKPITNTVGDFLQHIKSEDPGVDRATIYSTDGSRVSASTGLDVLLQSPFTLVLNDVKYQVDPPIHGPASYGYEETRPFDREHAPNIDDVKSMINSLYAALNVEQHQLEKEKILLRNLESLKIELEPLEKTKQELEARAQRRILGLTWAGLGLMGVQFGVLARLTWWEYSWDIMEPVTYFVTYGTSMAMFAYFVLCKQEYTFPDARDRQFLLTFHKSAQQTKFDVDQYNRVRYAIAQVELDLRRLRDPLQLHLPAVPAVGPADLASLSDGLADEEGARVATAASTPAAAR